MLAEQMKKILDNTRKVIKGLKTGNTTIPYKLHGIETANVETPDAEILLSIKLINDLLKQNFPFSTTIRFDEKKQVDISVTDVNIKTEKGNAIQLRISDAGIQFEKMKFKIGLQSNNVVLTLNFRVIKDEERFRLIAQGFFSSFKVNYLPKWLEKRIIDYLGAKILSPILDQDITDLLTFKKEFYTEYGPIHLNLIPENVSLTIDEKGIHLKAEFQKAQS